MNDKVFTAFLQCGPPFLLQLKSQPVSNQEIDLKALIL